MRLHFKTEQWLPYPLPVVFAFFANPQNLPPLMPAWQQARIDEATLVPAPPRPEGAAALPGIVAGNGTRLLITARGVPGLPLRQPWLALIRDFHWNRCFCDVQLKGPFAFWKHCHSVRQESRDGRDGTVVQDAVEYQLPLWPLSLPGAPAGHLAMKSLFSYRQRRAEVLVAEYAERCGATTASADGRPRT